MTLCTRDLGDSVSHVKVLDSRTKRVGVHAAERCVFVLSTMMKI